MTAGSLPHHPVGSRIGIGKHLAHPSRSAPPASSLDALIERLSLDTEADTISGAASGALFAYRSWCSIGRPASRPVGFAASSGSGFVSLSRITRLFQAWAGHATNPLDPLGSEKQGSMILSPPWRQRQASRRL